MKRKFAYGAVLKIQREFTLETIYRHLSNMKNIGMNQVVVWPSIYWWEERTNADYPFHTGKKILEFARELDMKIIMELEGQITCLEYAPDFLMKEEYYPLDKDGHKTNQGSGYGTMNYNHPEVQQLIAKCFHNTANAYKHCEALYGFDIYNETRFESYDIHTLRLFRCWLEAKYGSIDDLNRVWERAYYDWSQIQFSYWMWASVMPTVDYNQFKKDNMVKILNSWKTMIKCVIPDTIVIADNVYSSVSEDKHYDLPQDDWKVARCVDEFGISLYPKNDTTGFVPYRRWLTLSGIHSASPTGNFWISEMQSHNVSMFNPFSTVHTEDINWWNMEAIVNGAKGIIYWKWDPFMKGVQTLGRGLVDVKGNYTQRAGAAEKIARVLNRYEHEFMNYQPHAATCTILYDPLNHDFTKAYSRNHGQVLSDSIYLDSIDGLYHCLWNQQIYPQFITPEELLNCPSQCGKVLFITSQIYITEEMTKAILEYAENGGLVIHDGRFGMVDATGYVYENLPGGPCNHELGMDFCDIEPTDLMITMDAEWNCLLLEGYYERQVWNLWGSKSRVIGTYANGTPAIIETPCGRGNILSVSTYLWYGYHCQESDSVDTFVEILSRKYGLKTDYAEEPGVKVKRIGGTGGEIIFIFQYDKKKVNTAIHINGLKHGSYTICNMFNGDQISVRSAGDTARFEIQLNGCESAIYLLKASSEDNR